MHCIPHIRFIGWIVHGGTRPGLSNQDQHGVWTYLHHQENLACFTAHPQPLSFTCFLCLSLSHSRSQSFFICNLWPKLWTEQKVIKCWRGDSAVMVQPERTQSPWAGLTTAAHGLAHYRSCTYSLCAQAEGESKGQPGEFSVGPFYLQICFILLTFLVISFLPGLYFFVEVLTECFILTIEVSLNVLLYASIILA